MIRFTVVEFRNKNSAAVLEKDFLQVPDAEKFVDANIRKVSVEKGERRQVTRVIQRGNWDFHVIRQEWRAN